MIYMDHAATTPMKAEALQAMLPFFCDCFANASGSYRAARESRRAIDMAREETAALIGAKANEIYYTSGGSESDNWAIRGAINALPKEKRHVVTTAFEHHAVIRTCEALEQEGVKVTYVPVSTDGVVDPQRVFQAITAQTGLISVMLANNEVGTIQPVAQIAATAAQQGILIHTDAVQAVGHIPVDVKALGVDLLSMSAHKFGGPKGIGALYIRRGTRMTRLICGGEQESGLRAGTENTAAIVGMGKAAQLAEANMSGAMAAVTALRDAFIRMAQQRVPGVHINGLSQPRLPGHIHMTIEGADSSLLLMQLDMRGIAASSASACAAGAAERSHVIRAMGRGGDGQADLRFTISESNTLQEIEFTVDVLAGLLGQ